MGGVARISSGSVAGKLGTMLMLIPNGSNLAAGDFGPALFLLVLLAGGAFAVLGYLQAQKRRKELAEMAHSNGWSFRAARDRGMDDRFGQFSCLRHGSRRYAYNIMEGRAGARSVCAFDYHYQTGSGKNTHHHHFSAVIVNSRLPLRELAIREEGVFDKVTEFLGLDDIDFELQEFSDKFYVKAADRRWAFDVLHQETMEFLLSMPTFSIEIRGPYVMAYRSSRFGTGEFGDALGVINGIIDRLPEYLLRELKGVDA
jgi:hypothetical protein